MIKDTKRVIYTTLEFTRQEVLRILMGEVIEDKGKRRNGKDEPSIYRIYCSSPTTGDELEMELKLRRESNEKKSKRSKSKEEY